MTAISQRVRKFFAGHAGKKTMSAMATPRQSHAIREALSAEPASRRATLVTAQRDLRQETPLRYSAEPSASHASVEAWFAWATFP